jgi:putative ABC transport system permease protein
MFKNYFKITIRNLVKHKLFTLINIFGLATSMAICLVVLGHLSHEISFEDCHENKDRIYRLNGTYTSGDTLIYTSQVMSPLGPALSDDISQIEKTALFRVIGNVDLKIGQESFRSESENVHHGYERDGNVFCANTDFLDVFTLPLVQGDPETALEEPFSVLISETAAREYFRDQIPMGQTIKINDDLICHVTGILKDIPQNTQVHCDFIASYSSLERIGEKVDSWDQFERDYVYLLLKKNVDPSIVVQKIPAVIQKYLPAEQSQKYSFELQPFKDIYFSTYGSGRRGDIGPHGEASFIIEVSVITLFILLLAIANFVNLSTARSAERMKEVGIRKVLGAYRLNLMKQFLGESIMITFVSVLISLIPYEIFKMWVTPLLPREFFVDFYGSPMMMIMLLGMVVVVGVLAGFYPALFLSRFKPITALREKMGIQSSKSLLRRFLVVFQFAIAIMFICLTIILYNQINYATSAELGFDKKDILLLNFAGKNAAGNCRLMKNEILNSGNYLAATATNSPPGKMTYNYRALYTDEERQNRVVGKEYIADYDFFTTFGLEIIQGREFSEGIPGDAANGIIIDEATVKILDVGNPIGYRFYGKENFLEVIGVVKDFVGTPISYSGEKLSFIRFDPEKYRILAVKLPPDNIGKSVATMKDIFETTLPGIYFDYSFLEDDIDANYSELKGMMAMMLALALMAISMACLGIFGLVAYTAERKTKEIGIRKTLGASVTNIVTMLSRELIILIVIANVIACPLALLLANDFLQYHVLRVDIGAGTFIVTALLGILLALLAAGFQAIKAALANPIEALRYE